MKNKLLKTLTLSVLVFSSLCVMAQRRHRQLPPVAAGDSIVRGPYTLIFLSNDAGLNPLTKQRLIDAFFTVYPEEAARFNKNTLKKVIFYVDTAYEGVAATGGGMGRFNPSWLKNHPEDIDVVTHEVMHVVQSYKDYSPGWLTEGIADYVRYVYGVNNLKGDWTLPEYRPGQSYENAYRVTARFLLWVEKNKNKEIVDRMDAAMRDGAYTPALWVTLTGKSVDDLWKEYSQNPTLQLAYK